MSDGQEFCHKRKMLRQVRKRGLRFTTHDEAGYDEMKQVFRAVGLKLELGSMPGCSKCGNLVSCTCQINTQHSESCRYRRAANLPFELACPHGFQACPKCDPCDCGAVPSSDKRKSETT